MRRGTNNLRTKPRALRGDDFADFVPFIIIPATIRPTLSFDRKTSPSLSFFFFCHGFPPPQKKGISLDSGNNWPVKVSNAGRMRGECGNKREQRR